VFLHLNDNVVNDNIAYKKNIPLHGDSTTSNCLRNYVVANRVWPEQYT